MTDVLMHPPFLLFATIAVVVTASVVGHYWHAVRKAEIDAAVKQDMLARGMSADDIVRVVQAGSPAEGGCGQLAAK